MPDFDLSIDFYFFATLLLLAMGAGFLLRSRQLAKKMRKIAELEQEVIEAHAELLETQRDYCELESKVKQGDSPVINIKKKQDMASGTGKTENF